MKNQIKNILLTLIICPLLTQLVMAEVKVDVNLERMNLTDHVFYKVSSLDENPIPGFQSHGSLDTFTKSKKAYINIGPQGPDKRVWYFITLAPKFSKSHEYFLEIKPAYLTEIDFYLLDENKNILSTKNLGTYRPLKDRDIFFKNAVIKVNLEGKPRTLVFSTRANLQAFSLSLFNESSFFKYVLLDSLGQFMFYGLVAFMSLYYLLLFISTGMKEYFYYSIFILATAYQYLVIEGYIHLFVFPVESAQMIGTKVIATDIFYIAWPVTIFAFFNFTRYFLDLETGRKKWPLLICKSVSIFYLCFAILSLFIPYSVAVSVLLLTNFAIPPLVISIGIASLKRSPDAKFYLLAFSFFFVGATIHTLYSAAVIDIDKYVEYAQQIGSGLEFLLLSFSLASRMKRLQRKNINMQKSFSDSLKTEISRIRHLNHELKKLIYPHQANLIADGKKVEETMPLGSGDACIICFDIQNSSKIGHTDHHEFFETVINKCHKLMTTHYDQESLQANAYMIKEMGDGFLCSVGFPFACSGDIKKSSFALAESFVDIFNDTSRNYFENQEVYCSVGIAFGEVTGFFPKTGRKLYDLFGNTIIKATRYESFRKMLFKAGIKQGNIIVVQNKVYEGLDSETKKGLTPFTLTKFKVRDDSEAKNLYYRLVENSKSNFNQNPTTAFKDEKSEDELDMCI